MKRFIALKILGIIWIPVIFIIWQVLKRNPDWVEVYYSQGFYPVLIKNISAISSVFSFALHELVVIALILLVSFLLYLDFKLNEKWWNKIHGAFLSVVSIAGWMYFLLVFMWGLNHLRHPVEQIFALNEPLNATEQIEVLNYVIEQANQSAINMQINKNAITFDQCADIEDSFQILDKQVNQAMIAFLKAQNLPPIKAAEGRYFIFSDLVRKMGIAGLYNPIVAQPAISKSLPASLQSQTLSHEYAHLNGFADEAAADFVAYASLWYSHSKQLRYEAWLSLIWQLGEINHPNLSDATKADLNCIALNVQEFKRKSKNSLVSIILKPAVKATNNQYLKQSGHPEGLKRYAYGEQLALRYLYKNLNK
ncbi:MAG: DUF3810 family protein [Saccharospirillaceae bacterium]|nr:DUF3810 family protein [Pseudomonadales bacterium]NRB81713.1 DUF3810 family protein [Saccharospirillaceae bacterium]